jgi:hypothetical protein
MPDMFTGTIMDMIQQGYPFEPMLNFLDNMSQNPSDHAIVELFEFMENKNMPITPDGHFLAYKAVKSDYKDIYSSTFDNSVAISRIAIMTGYLAFSLLFVAGLAFYLSVRTDAPLGAVGVAVGISILLNILDAITALGKIRDWLPVHYAFSWFDALASTIDWSTMIRGASYCAISGIILFALSINRFAHKDITS